MHEVEDKRINNEYAVFFNSFFDNILNFSLMKI